MRAFNLRLTDEARDDLLAMAAYAGKPNNLAAGFYALVAEWRRLKAEREDRRRRVYDRAAQIARREDQRDAVGARLAQHEEYCDALERRADDAEGQ